MARVGVSITKSCSFRSGVQEFSNVYYYETPSLPDATLADQLIDAVTTIEKTIHSTTVTFVRGRCWSHVGSAAGNNMISQKNLSGTGARTTVAGMDKERAFLVQVSAGSNSRGQPVKLRKWFHSCGVFFSGQTVGSGQLDNTTPFSAGDKTSIAAAALPLEFITVGGQNFLITAKSGRQPDASAHFQSHPYLEHHQLGDMWRAQ